MKKNLFLTALLIIALSIVGCGKNDEAKDVVKDEPEKAAKVETKSESAPRIENSASFSSNDISGEGFTLTYVEAKKHDMQTGDLKYPAMIIQLANYDSGGGSWHPSPNEDGQCRITVNFSAPSGQELKVGMYEIDGNMGEDFYLSVGIEGMVDGNVKNIGLLNGEGIGEITQIDDKTITAKIDLKDSTGTTINATFKTEYTKSVF